MIEKIARRAGGFASSTALRWVGAGADKVAEVSPIGDDGSHKGGRRLAAVAAGGVALLTSKPVRSALEHGLRSASKALRATPPSGNGNGKASGNGNGTRDLTEKTRAELYELAKKMDLPGRSAMSKDELAKALGR